jgi:predicted TIM-barrel fold metal-dependent hydrolase
MPAAYRERILREHPVDRLLFASDSPWTDQGEELRFLLELPYLTDGEKERICGSNGAGLLGLEGESESA